MLVAQPCTTILLTADGPDPNHVGCGAVLEQPSALLKPLQYHCFLGCCVSVLLPGWPLFSAWTLVYKMVSKQSKLDSQEYSPVSMEVTMATYNFLRRCHSKPLSLR